MTFFNVLTIPRANKYCIQIFMEHVNCIATRYLVQLYKNMDRQIPQFNRLVISKIQQRNMQTHHQKLYSIQRSKNRTNLSALNFTRLNFKNDKVQEQRQAEIERSNIILFQRMNTIMKRRDPTNQGKVKKVKITSNRFLSYIERINEENQHLLVRLCNSKPTIDNNKFIEQRKKQLSILKSLGRNSVASEKTKSLASPLPKSKESFRYIQPQKNKAEIHKTSSLGHFSESYQIHLNVRPQYTSKQQEDKQMKETQQYFKRQMAKIQTKRSRAQSNLADYQSHQRYRAFINQPSEQGNSLRKTNSFIEKSIILFTSFKMFRSSMFKVFIVRKHKHYVIICAQMINPSHQYILRLQEAEGNQFLSQIDYNYESVIDNLAIKNEQLIIKQIKSKKKNEKPQNQSFIKLKRIINPSHITQQAVQQSPSRNQQASDEQYPNINISL